MANPIAKFITKSVLTALTKKGAPTKGQKAAITRAAKNADMPVAEFKAEAKKVIKNKTTPKKIVAVKKPKSKATNLTAGLTKAEKRERSRLIAQSKKDAEKAKLEREGVSLKDQEPDRIKLTAGGTEVLPSKEQIDPKIRSYSKARIRHLIKTGQAKMVVDKNGKRSIITTGKFASPQSMVADEMGLSNKGVLPTEKEAQAMGMSIKSFKSGSGKKTIGKSKKKKDYDYPDLHRIGSGYILKGKKGEPDLWVRQKKGGAIKRNKGGAVRGVGQAIKGFGNANYSKKMY